MLAIAPMPVDGVKHNQSEHKAAPLILLPALPATCDHYDVMTIDQAPPSEVEEFVSTEADDREQQAFFVDSSSSSVVLPPRREQVRQVRPAVQKKNTRPRLGDPSIFRAAPLTSDAPAQADDDLPPAIEASSSLYGRILHSKYTVLALFAAVVVVFLFLVVYCVQQFACPPQESSASTATALQHVRVKNDDYNHLKERYGEQAKAAALAEKLAADRTKTKIIQDAPPQEIISNP